eukprot:SAG31_NODE_2451_length_5667_cov_5.877694_2_plen_78_part_00
MASELVEAQGDEYRTIFVMPQTADSCAVVQQKTVEFPAFSTAAVAFLMRGVATESALPLRYESSVLCQRASFENSFS